MSDKFSLLLTILTLIWTIFVSEVQLLNTTISKDQCKSDGQKAKSTNLAEKYFGISPTDEFNMMDYSMENMLSLIASEPITIKAIAFQHYYESYMIRPYFLHLIIRIHRSVIGSEPLKFAINAKDDQWSSIRKSITNVIRIDIYPDPIYYRVMMGNLTIFGEPTYKKVVQPVVKYIYQVDSNGKSTKISPDNLNAKGYSEDKDWLRKCATTGILDNSRNSLFCPEDPLKQKSRMTILFDKPYDADKILVFHYAAKLIQKNRKPKIIEFSEYNSFLWFAVEDNNAKQKTCFYTETKNFMPTMDIIYEVNCPVKQITKLHIACDGTSKCRIVLCALKFLSSKY